ncbi:hypothetical protein [Streptomyces sp. NPDC046631]|uniref:hypothetical protein n=1 Tax=unclassified Streptomyces TaxID=2593676 RepID=UPI0033F69B39
MRVVGERIVAVHGIGNYYPNRSPGDAAAALCTKWAAALRTPAELHAAYYAHLLRPTGGQRGGGALLGDAAVEELTDTEAAVLTAWLAAYGVPDGSVAQGRPTQLLRQPLSWVAQHSGKPAHPLFRLLARLAREVTWYFERPECRTAARADVAATIARVRPRAIVAHSLGSVVAYEALWSASGAAVPVDLLVTVGSPLALPGAVFDRLDPPPVAGRGRRPPSVDRWINIADVGDLVALPRQLTRAFDGIEEDIETTIAPVDFHTFGKYLASEAVEKALLSASGY